MPLVPGISANIREEAAPAAPLPEAADIEIIDADEGEDVPEMDDKGNILRIDHPDGSITVSLNGSPVAEADDENPPGWFDNLVDKIDDLELSRISDELMRGISDDQQSRRTGWRTAPPAFASLASRSRSQASRVPLTGLLWRA
jgi:hypothetical protein